jgi:hypothetical protein
MRLNFQQQKPINLSAGGPSFVPDQSREADQEANIRLQMINEQQQALKDMAQAAVMVAKANKMASDQEDQAKLDEIELEVIEYGRKFNSGIESNQEFSVVDNDLIFYPQDGYFGKSFQNTREEDFLAKLEAKYTDENRSNLFNQKLKNVIRKAANPFLLNAQRQSIENTKNAVKVSTEKKVISISNQLSRGELSLDNAFQRISNEVEKYRPTLGTETDTTIIHAKKDLATQYAMAMSDGTKDQRKAYRDMVVRETTGEQQSNLGSLFWYGLHQSYGPQSLQLTKEESSLALQNSVLTPDERELRDFIVSYSIASFDPGKKGKNEDMTVIAKPDMESLRKDFPELQDTVLSKAVFQAAKNYEAIINKKSKPSKDEWDKVKSEYNERARKWVLYYRTLFARDERSRLNQIGSNTPPSMPEEQVAIFDKVSKHPEFLQKKHELDIMNSIFIWGKKILQKKIMKKESATNISWLNDEIDKLKKWFSSRENMTQSDHYPHALGYIQQIEDDKNRRISNFFKNPGEYEQRRDDPKWERRKGDEQTKIIIQGYMDDVLRENTAEGKYIERINK